MGLLIPNPTADWQIAPHIVPKLKSKAKFRMKIDLRPVNAATKKRAWQMPHLDSEMQDFKSCISLSRREVLWLAVFSLSRFMFWILAAATISRLLWKVRFGLP